jgi:hypothetical protein
MTEGGWVDSQSLRSVLAILRMMKEHKKNQSPADLIAVWAGKTVDDAARLRVACYIVEQVSIAQTVIANSQLTEEAKAGVTGTLRGLKACFSVSGLTTQYGSHLPEIEGAIANFVILLSAAGIIEAPAVPPEADEIIAEIEAVMAAFEDPQIDPAVRDVAKRHLLILATLLRHIPVFGIEAAMGSYFDLMMKIRRADIETSEESQKKTSSLWDKMGTWSGRFDTIDKLWNHGARLIGQAEKLPNLLAYIPS